MVIWFEIVRSISQENALALAAGLGLDYINWFIGTSFAFEGVFEFAELGGQEKGPGKNL